MLKLASVNLLNTKYIRIAIIFALAALQVASVTFIAERYADNLFYFVNLTYFALGFLSIGWRQAVKNISLVTLPAVIVIALLLLVISILNGRIDNAVATIKVSFMLWGLILAVGLPIFLFGFCLRFITIKLLNMRTQKAIF